MNTNIKSVLLFILFLLVSCGKKEPANFQLSKGVAIIEGKVSNFQNNSNLIRFAGTDITNDINLYAKIDSLGYFHKEIEIYHPHSISLFYENGYARVYVKPGDSLFVEMDANLFKENYFAYYNVSGSNPETSNNMRDFLKFYTPEFDFSQSNKPVNDYLNILRKRISFEDSIRQEFRKKYKTTADFDNWSYKDMIYSNANLLVSYSILNERNNIKLKGDLFDKKLFPVNNDSAFVSSSYLSHLNNYSIFKYVKNDSTLKSLFENKNYETAYQQIIQNILKYEKPGLSRDYMVYQRLQDRHSPIDFASVLESQKPYIQNQELLDNLFKIKSDYVKRGNIEEKTDTNWSETTRNFWKALKEKHKNKVIYIDIFATWCGNCMNEIQPSYDLHKDFEGKPVVFVNLCMDSEKADWERLIDQDILKGDNYFISKDETKIFSNELNFSSFPTYMIMDKNGNLINKYAPRPSQKDEITELLNNLIEEI